MTGGPRKDHGSTALLTEQQFQNDERTIMNTFSIGDTVRVLSGQLGTMTGQVGTVVAYDPKQEKYLVRVGLMLQNFFAADEIELFRPGAR